MKDLSEFLIEGTEVEAIQRKGVIDFTRIVAKPITAELAEQQKPEFKFFMTWEERRKLLAIKPFPDCVNQHNYPDCPMTIESMERVDIDRCVRCPYGGSHLRRLYDCLIEETVKTVQTTQITQTTEIVQTIVETRIVKVQDNEGDEE